MLDVIENETRDVDGFDRFCMRYGEWLKARSEDVNAPKDIELGADLALAERKEQALIDFMATPASQAWMITKKVEAFEVFLVDMADIVRNDGLEFVLLAGIKADLFSLQLRQCGS